MRSRGQSRYYGCKQGCTLIIQNEIDVARRSNNAKKEENTKKERKPMVVRMIIPVASTMIMIMTDIATKTVKIKLIDFSTMMVPKLAR